MVCSDIKKHSTWAFVLILVATFVLTSAFSTSVYAQGQDTNSRKAGPAATKKLTVYGQTNGSGSAPAGAQYRIWRLVTFGSDVLEVNWTALTAGAHEHTLTRWKTYRIEFSLVPDYWKPSSIDVYLGGNRSRTGNYKTYFHSIGEDGKIYVDSDIDGTPGAPAGAQFRVIHSGGRFETSWRNLNSDGSAVLVEGLDHDLFGQRYYIEYTQNPAGHTGAPTDQVDLFWFDHVDEVTANYSAITYTLNFVAGSGGSIGGPNPQSVKYGQDGQTVTATPDAAHNFLNWTKSGGGVVSTNPGFKPTNVQGNETYTANFQVKTYNVTFNAGANGQVQSGGSPMNSVSFPVTHGSSTPAVDAVPNTGYHFVNWTGSMTSTDDPLTISNVQSNMTVTANFEIDTFNVKVTSYTDGAASTAGGSTDKDGANTVNYNGSITIDPTAEPGYVFTGWSVDAGGADDPLTVNNITSNLEIRAHFATDEGSLEIKLVNAPSGAQFNITDSPALFTPSNPYTSNFGPSSVPSGDYKVQFVDVPGYNLAVTKSESGPPPAPANQSITANVERNGTTVVTGTYSRQYGDLTVVPTATFINSGATYSISGPTGVGSPSDFADKSGLNSQFGQTDVPTGAYMITPTAVPGFTFAGSSTIGGSLQKSTPSAPKFSGNPMVGTIDEYEEHVVTLDLERDTGELHVNITQNGAGATYDISGPTDYGDPSDFADQTGLSADFDDNSIPTGTYNVTFSAVTGYTLEVTTSVSDDNGGTQFSETDASTGLIEKGETHTINAVYTRDLGSLNVVTDPASAGGSFNFTSYPSDFTPSNPVSGSFGPTDVPTGTYEVEFLPVGGYTLASTTGSVEVTKEGTHVITGTYVRDLGNLQVNIAPTGVGAWRIVGQSGWRAGGTTQFDIGTGSAFVEFQPVDGYTKPDTVEVDISKGNTTVVDAIYNEQNAPGGTLSIYFDNKNVVDLGAQWRIVEIPEEEAASIAANTWHNSNDVIVGLPQGTYAVEYKTAAGYIKPALPSVEVKASEHNRFLAEYARPFIAHRSDYDGNGTEDLGTYNGETRRYQVAVGRAGGADPAAKLIVNKKFGTINDVMAPGDYDGDGIADLALYRPKTGEWFIRGQYTIKKFGEENDIPVPGDYNGDGMTDPALYRPASGEWMIYYYPSNKVVKTKLGGPDEVPVPANWDGDQAGMTDIAVFNVDNGKWTVAVFKEKRNKWIKVRKLGGSYGEVGDIPVQGDWDGDGDADFALYRRPTHTWMTNGILEDLQFGEDGDIPVANDWAGLGRIIPAIFRPENGLWRSIDNLLNQRHGAGGMPMASGRR